MKKRMTSFSMILLTFLLAGCNAAQESPSLENQTENNVQESAEHAPKDSQSDAKVYCILSVDESTNTLSLDEIEWLTLEDTERLKEIKLNPNKDLPDGFYLYNAAVEPISIPVADTAQFICLDDTNHFAEVKMDFAGFQARYADIKKQYGELASTTPYDITIKDGEVIIVSERYVP